MYSISPIHFQKLLNYPAFEGLELKNNEPNHPCFGSIKFATTMIDAPIVSHLKEEVGIYFYKQTRHDKIYFEFVKIDSTYYNLGRCVLELEDDPFKIRNFSMTDHNYQDSQLMVIDNQFAHFVADDDNFFIFRSRMPCISCKSEKGVLGLNGQVDLCIDCILYINMTLRALHR